MCNVPLPPVGPVLLQSLCLSLGILQHSLPPQAESLSWERVLRDIEHCHVSLSSISASIAFMVLCQRGWRVLAVIFPLSFSFLLSGGSDLGNLVLGLTRTLRRHKGQRQDVRRQRYSQKFLCREALQACRETSKLN